MLIILGNTLRKKLSFSAVAGVLFLLAFPNSLLAAPQDTDSKRVELQRLSDQMEQMNDRLGGLVEDYNVAKSQLSSTNAKLNTTQARLGSAEKELAQVNKTLNSRLLAMYQTDTLSIVNVFLSSTSFTDFVQRLDLFSRIASNDASTVARAKVVRRQVETTKKSLERLQESQRGSVRFIENKKQAVQSELSAQQRLMADKKDEIAELERAQSARQAALDREALAAAAQAAAQGRDQTRGVSVTGRRTLDRVNRLSQRSTPAPNGSKASRVISIGLSYRGVPYVWGGSTPRGFDCSGFTMYVFRQVGISLPHSSRAQANMGRPVALNNLQPGDLVFRGNPIHHVGIYIGGGNIVHSPHSGSVVKVSPARGIIRARRLL